MAKRKSQKQQDSAALQQVAMAHMLDTWKLLRKAGHAAQKEADFDATEIMWQLSDQLAECQFKYIDYVLLKKS